MPESGRWLAYPNQIEDFSCHLTQLSHDPVLSPDPSCLAFTTRRDHVPGGERRKQPAAAPESVPRHPNFSRTKIFPRIPDAPLCAVTRPVTLRAGFESHEARAMRRTRSMTEAA